MTKLDFIDDTESAPSTPRGYKYTLFVPPRDAHEALWGGEVSGVEGAISTFGADEVSPPLRSS
jgi:intermediate cleaving peptidase 55